jgi:glycine/D-amino acid oxidase-like deaminating enzyme
MEKMPLQLDIAIIGGGIAGLWALNHLRASGYHAALFEERALGGEQTAATQGILHSGIKYQLSGPAQSAPDSLSLMPAAWRDCLAGRGKVDLRACRVLSEHVYLWSSTDASPGLGAGLTNQSSRAAVSEVQSQARPMPLQASAFRGRVYCVEEQVLDIPSLVETLAAQQREAIFRIDWGTAALQHTQGRACIVLPHCTVQPECLLLLAGAGNAALVAALGGTAPAMQRRPLQQVLVKHQYQPAFFAHCVEGKSSPRLTVTSHRTRAGEPLWSLGGELATAGAHDDPAELIARAKRELGELLPWLDLGATEWRTLKLDRAEPQRPDGSRTEGAFVSRVAGAGNVLAGWPVKLCLCPDLGEQIQRALEGALILPRHKGDLSPLHALGRPPLAPPCWETLFT